MSNHKSKEIVDYIEGSHTDNKRKRKSRNIFDVVPMSERYPRSWVARKKNENLTKTCKFYHIEIAEAEGYNVYQNTIAIEERIRKADYSYLREYKVIDGQLIGIIEYRGLHLGQFTGAKYL